MIDELDVVSIDKKLKGIFLSRFGLDMENLNKDHLDKELLGFRFRFKARDLLCLHHFVEKEFDIVIPEEAIVEGRFNTYNNILAIVKSKIEFEKV